MGPGVLHFMKFLGGPLPDLDGICTGGGNAEGSAGVRPRRSSGMDVMGSEAFLGGCSKSCYSAVMLGR